MSEYKLENRANIKRRSEIILLGPEKATTSEPAAEKLTVEVEWMFSSVFRWSQFDSPQHVVKKPKSFSFIRPIFHAKALYQKEKHVRDPKLAPFWSLPGSSGSFHPPIAERSIRSRE